jgi:hypothetical protein
MKSGRVVDVANGFLLQCGCCNIVGEGKKKARGKLRRGTTTTTTRHQEQEGKQEQEEEKKLNFECIEETQHFPSMKTKFEWGFFISLSLSLSLSLSIYIYMTFHPFIPHLWMNEKTFFHPPKKLNLSVYLGNYNISNPSKPNLDGVFFFFSPLSFLVYHIPLFHPKFVNE